MPGAPEQRTAPDGFHQNWLVVEPYPSGNIWGSSVGMMKFPIYGKIENGPNHQPDLFWSILIRFSIINPPLWGIPTDVNLQKGVLLTIHHQRSHVFLVIFGTKQIPSRNPPKLCGRISVHLIPPFSSSPAVKKSTRMGTPKVIAGVAGLWFTQIFYIILLYHTHHL